MKMKNLLLTIAATFGMTVLTMAQNVPNYVPTNGLVGWWPFNGNANDESVNNNNGTVYGAALTTDRFGNPNEAYSFDGNSDFMQISNSTSLNFNQGTINIWFSTSQTTFMNLIERNIFSNASNENWALAINQTTSGDLSLYTKHNSNCIAGNGWQTNLVNQSLLLNNWHMLTGAIKNSTTEIYLDGLLVNTFNTLSLMDICGGDIQIARHWLNEPRFFSGKLDDIGIWNRVLTQQEITDLYDAVNCANNTTITPQTNSLTTGSTATFGASTSDPNPSYVWQSNFGQGFQTLNNFGNYSGTNTPALNISNVQLANHNQPIRVITTSGNCIDTSNVAIISITDTCINTITVTTLITVTDTLLINTTITGLNPPNNANTIKVFPNPTNDHITINYGNFSVMNGYQLKIENSLGQQVFQTNITQQSDYLNLTTWGGNGLYFVHIIDPQGNTIDIRKIVLQ